MSEESERAVDKNSTSKRSKMGRAARRRKAKTRSIDLALKALLRGESIEDGDDVSLHLPIDRSQPLPGVIQRRKENKVEFDKDEKLLVSQLGYMPGNAVGVVGRTKHLEQLYPRLYKLLQNLESQKSDGITNVDPGSTPTALKLYPLAIRNVHKGGKSGRKFKSRKRGHKEISQGGCESKEDESNDNGDGINSVIEPFPTMFWLTHPILRTLISQLELGSSDNVIKMQEKLSSLPEYLSRMNDAHESYGKHRWQLLTDEDKADVERRKWTEAVGGVRGVAGIRNFDTVKCLHTHSAHYLAYLGNVTDKVDQNFVSECNLVGKWVLEAVEKIVSEMNKEENVGEKVGNQSKK